MIAEKFIRAFVPAAKRAGLTRIRCFVEQTEEMFVNVFRGNPERTTISHLERVFLEGEWQGRIGSAYVENLDASSFDELIETIRQSAECNAKVWNYDELKHVTGVAEEERYCPDIAAVTERLLVAEQTALTTDPRVQVVSECWFERSSRSVMLTDGQRTMSENCGVADKFGIKVAAGENTEIQTCFHSYLLSGEEDMAELARETAMDAVTQLGARTLPTANYPVILQNRVVSELIAAYLPAFYAENVKSGMSCLCGKLHTHVGSGGVTISEDPMLPGTALRRSFDDEGEPTRAKDLIRCGELTAYLCNRAAAEDGMAAGNGFRTEYKCPVTTGVTNVLLHSGDSTLEELIREMGDGVVITHIDGAFAGAKYASGDFALIAKGFCVKNKKAADTIHRITIAGDFVSMLCSVRSVGADPFTMHDGTRTVTAPSVLVEKLTISGT